MNKIDDLVERYEEVRQQLVTDMQASMKTLFKEFFENNPTIALIKWRQYTPYFNDGDECIFNVHDMYFALNGDDLDENANEDDMRGDGKYNQDSDGEWIKTTIPEEERFQEFRKIVNKIPDDIFKATFGDHCQVTATRDGFEVEEYEHE